MCARAAELISGILIVALATRYLGVKDFGVYAFLWALSAVFSPLIAFGCARILIRDISINRQKAPGYLTAGLMVNTVMTLAVFMPTFLIALAFGLRAPDVLVALCIAVVYQAFQVMTKTVTSVFNAYERMHYDLLITVLTRVLSIMFFVAAIAGSLGLVGLFGSLAAAHAAGLCSALAILQKKFFKPRWRAHGRYIGYMLKESFSVALSTFIGQGYRHINVFLLKALQDFAQVSFYQAPQRIIAPLTMFPASFLIAFAPSLARMAHHDSSSRQMTEAYLTILKYILIISLPVCIYVTIYAGELVRLLFGQEFIPAARSFQILIWLLVPLFVNALLNFVLISIRKQKVMAVGNGVALVLNVVLGIPLIRYFGHVGASIAYLGSSVGLICVGFYFLRTYLGPVPIHRVVWKPVCAGALLFICMHLLGPAVSMGAVTAGACVAYPGMLAALRTFTRDEVEILKAGFNRRCG
jgi:O-antigen/teichoic acid export membrane protein